MHAGSLINAVCLPTTAHYTQSATMSTKKIKRSRNGCHACKRLKIKCDEAKPLCLHCVKTNTACDYSLKLTWGGRPFKDVTKRKGEYRGKVLDKSLGIEKSEGNPSVKLEESVKPLTMKFSNKSTGTSNSKLPDVFQQSVWNGYVSKGMESLEKSTDEPIHNPQSISESGTFNISTVPLNIPVTIQNSPDQHYDTHQLATVISPPNVTGEPHVFTHLDGSLPSFLTRNGMSILSLEDKTIEEGRLNGKEIHSHKIPNIDPQNRSNMEVNPQNRSNMEVHPQNRSNMGTLPQDRRRIGLSLDVSILSPDIFNGIESLDSVMEKTVDGAFKLQNSEIFNNYVTTTMESEEPLEDFLADYSQDLSRVEAYMPSEQSNLIDDHVSFRFHRIKEEQEEEEEDELFKVGLNGGAESKESESGGGAKSVSGGGAESVSDGGVKSVSEDLNWSEDNELLPNSKLLILPDSRSSVVTPEEVFSSVPTQFVPLPQILLSVPFYRNLMHFWVHTASQHLVPAPAHVYKENPFKVLLPQMAMEYPSILTTLLAFSASLRSLLLGNNDTPQIVLDQLLSRSCTELLKLLRNKQLATSDPTLATVLILSSYEVFVSKDLARHHAHNLGARKIIMARKNLNDVSAANESDINFFLMRWFVYADVMGSLSATNSSLTADEEELQYEPARWVKSMSENMDEMDPRRDIDHILGFDVNFMPHFSCITQLIRRAAATTTTEGSVGSIPTSIVTAAMEVKDLMTRIFEAGEQRRQVKIEKIMDVAQADSPTAIHTLVWQDAVLRSTNRLFYLMGVVNLYRRVLGIPRALSAVQELVREMYVVCRESIESKSPADICTIFCSFTAGCEALDTDMREFYRARFVALCEMGNHGAAKGLRIMRVCWERGVDWIVAAKMLNIDFVLL